MKQRPYLIDDEDHDFFVGWGSYRHHEATITDVTYAKWGGFQANAIPSLRDVWKRKGHKERRKRHSEMMKRLWKEGRIVAHETTEELCEKRRKTAKDTWERRRKGELPMPNYCKASPRSRPCTIDGITIYDSVNQLIRALGKGKNGYRHPNFRFI